MQQEICKAQDLLNENGQLNVCGWARSSLLRYDRDHIAAGRLRIREQDRYFVVNKDCAVILSVADNGNRGLISASVLDFRKSSQHTEFIMKHFPMGRLSLPATSRHGDTAYSSKRVGMKFSKAGDYRFLRCEFLNFCDGRHLYANLELHEPAKQESIVTALPFEKNKKAFSYSQKINCMPASGVVRMGGEEYLFNPESSFATLSWERGVISGKSAGLWASASGTVKGVRFGFNLGSGIGDTAAATENIIFYNGVGHKLGKVTFPVSEKELAKPWTVSSDDGRLEMKFTPFFECTARKLAGLASGSRHQVFGHYSGKVVLDDGTSFPVKEIIGFAEKTTGRG